MINFKKEKKKINLIKARKNNLNQIKKKKKIKIKVAFVNK